MEIEIIAVSCSFLPVSGCLLGVSLLETDFSVQSSLLFCLHWHPRWFHGYSLCLFCKICASHYRYCISVLGAGCKVVITHHNMAVKDMCKPTSGSRGSRGLLGGCCEGRGVCAWHTQFSAGICSSCAGIQAEAGLLSNGASSSWWCSTPAVPELFHGAVQALCWPAWTLHWWINVMEPMSSVTWVWQLSRSWVQPPHCLLFHHNSSCEKGRCESLPLILN